MRQRVGGPDKHSWRYLVEVRNSVMILCVLVLVTAVSAGKKYEHVLNDSAYTQAPIQT